MDCDKIYLAAGSGRSASFDVLPVSRSTLDDRTGEHAAAGGHKKQKKRQGRNLAS